MRFTPAHAGGRGFLLALALTAALAAPRLSSADVITIDDGGKPGTTDLPFTCSVNGDRLLWLPTMGFVYRNVEPFALSPGDTIAFDIQMPGAADLGFRPQVDLSLAHASDPANPFKPDDLTGSDFTIVAHGAVASGAGNQTVRDYDLAFTVDAPFRFPGGGLIIRVSNPQGALATRTDQQCVSVITADTGPTGTNRLVGTFQLEPGEFPFTNVGMGVPGVPYVRITWTARCGDGIVSGKEQCDDGNTDATDRCTNTCTIARCGDGVKAANEECDDGNTDDTDGCTNRCTIAACGDGVKAVDEECDNSASPDHPDPYCDSDCHLHAFAKGSGCSTGGGVGLAVVLVIAALALRRRATGLAILVVGLWAGSAEAQAPRTADGFRVDRFEMAPSVDDGLVVQDPGVLRHMVWSVNAALGYTNTLLRVVPRLSSNDGIDVVGTRLSAYLDFALGLRDRFELHAAVPFAIAQSSESGIAAGLMLRSAGASAVGDGHLGGSVLLYSGSNGARGVQLGAAADLAIPVGSENSFTSDGKVGGELVATAAYAGPGYRLAANAGVRYRPEINYVSSDQGTELIGRAGLFVPVAHERLMTSLELDTIARAAGHDAFRALGSPILALLGARYHFAGGIRAGAGIGAGLTQAPGSPTVRVIFTVGYSPEPPRTRLAPRPNDRDGDGIIDNLDKCPDQPEDFNGYQDDDGCPDVLETERDRIVDNPPAPGEPLTLEQVITLPAPIEFKFDTAIMLPGAEIYLNQVLAILKAHPEVTKLEIQGHTSSEGGYDYNLRLSDDRAKAVYQWLVDHGIDGQRLVPKGYGLTVPLFLNDSEAHRQRNRRVQFRLIEQAPGSAPIHSLPRGRPEALPGTPAPTPTPATPRAP
ncbi:MAG TPA: OmpA family protein [Kofleriaceae bacterium]